MAVTPVAPTTATSTAPFGLDFQSLLQIILKQLTFQDPLKPVDNFEFVSQLAQFSQLEQTQTLNDSVTNLLASQSATQAVSLLGRTVDVNADASNGTAALSGVVQAVSFSNGEPQVTVKTADGSTVANISIANIATVR